MSDDLLERALDAYHEEYHRHWRDGGDAQDHDEAHRCGLEAVLALSAASEYRVRWQREGYGPRVKLYQTRAGAERFALILQGRTTEATGEDPEALACCSGHECGCGGVTIAEAAAEHYKRVPPLTAGPIIETRPVGSWSAVAA